MRGLGVRRNRPAVVEFGRSMSGNRLNLEATAVEVSSASTLPPPALPKIKYGTNNSWAWTKPSATSKRREHEKPGKPFTFIRRLNGSQMPP